MDKEKLVMDEEDQKEKLLREEELQRLCHGMAYGDDSDKTFDRYCFLMGMNLTQEEKMKLKEETFYD